MRLFDTHCHLQDPAFADDACEAIDRAEHAGLAGLVICGYDAPSNQAAIELAATSPIAHPTVGFHPHDAKDLTPALLAELESLASLPEVVGIGEIGLDFFRDHSPRDLQRRALDDQLGIALRLGKPVSVHTRSAEDAVYDHLAPFARSWAAAASGPPGVMHCFGGTLEQAQRFVGLGFLVSIACAITYPKNEEARRIAAGLPLESLVVETDSPYLPPQDRRGKRNEPAFVEAAVAAIGQARGIPATVVADATTANAAKLFKVAIPTAAGVS
jgi:TatD DNase family protein